MAQFSKKKSSSQALVAAGTLPMQFDIVAPNCKVCQSPYRQQIDLLAATGWQQVSIRKHFNQVIGEEYFTKDSISRHVKRHLSIRGAAVRRVMEARAKQFGVAVDEVDGFITTKAGVLDTIVQTGLQSLHQGLTSAEPKDMLAAIQMLEKMESEWKETAIDEMLKEFRAFSAAVKLHVTEDVYEKIYQDFERQLGTDSAALQPLQIMPPSTEEIIIEDGDLVEDDEVAGEVSDDA